MRKLFAALVTGVALAVTSSSAVLAGDLKVRDSGSPDSGTCGNSWADDTFTRQFDV